jgi:tetratricopeptide (TPR) repeat protein
MMKQTDAASSGPELGGDFGGPVAVGGGEAVDMREAQGSVYKPSGPVTQIWNTFKRVMPITGFIILALGLVVGLGVAAGLINIEALTALLPTPMAFEPASENQSLIIVADFEDRSGGRYQGVDPAQYIYERLVEQARADGLDVRIERLREVVDDNTVRATGEVYSATLVLWGWYDATITPRMERIKTRSEYHFTEEGMHFSLADPQKALVNYERALELNSNYDSVYKNRGLIYHNMGEYEKALDDYNCALELNPEYAKVYFNRGNTYGNMGEYQKALDDYNQALELNAEYIAAYNNQGVAYKSMGEYETVCARAIPLTTGQATR